MQVREFDTKQVIRKLMRHFNTLIQDFGEFLALKGSFNIPIVRYPLLFNPCDFLHDGIIRILVVV